MSSSTDETKTRVINIPYSLSLLAFSGSRLLVDAVLYPFDTVKTRLQSADGFWKSGGFRHAYRGLVPSCVGCIPTTALSLYLHQSTFNQQEDPSADLLSFGIGTYARGLATSFVHVPFEVVKQRRQTGTTPTRQLVHNAFRNEGVFGIYRGFWSTAVLDCAVISVSIPLLESFKFIYSEQVERPLNNTEVFACGLVGGGVAAFVTTPLDVGKTRIMLHTLSEESISSSRRIPSLISILRSIYYEHGLKGLYAGGIPRTAVLPLGSAMFSVLYIYTVIQLGLIYANVTE